VNGNEWSAVVAESSEFPAVWIAVAIPIAFFTLLILVCFFERRLTNPYIEIDSTSPESDAPPHRLISQYVILMSNDAEANGFDFGSVIAHRKYPQIKVVGTVWLSSDRRTLMLCGSGTVLGAPVYQTWLVSPRSDGTWIITTDNNDEGDSSGTELTKRILNARFNELLQVHTQRIQNDRQTASYGAGRPFDLLCDRTRRKYQRLYLQGYARSRDAAGEYWSYSVMSSLRSVPRFFAQFGGALLQFWRVNKTPIAPTTLSEPIESHQARWRQAGEAPDCLGS
jgi:hypothetical protein